MFSPRFVDVLLPLDRYDSASTEYFRTINCQMYDRTDINKPEKIKKILEEIWRVREEGGCFLSRDDGDELIDVGDTNVINFFNDYYIFVWQPHRRGRFTPTPRNPNTYRRICRKPTDVVFPLEANDPEGHIGTGKAKFLDEMRRKYDSVTDLVEQRNALLDVIRKYRRTQRCRFLALNEDNYYYDIGDLDVYQKFIFYHIRLQNEANHSTNHSQSHTGVQNNAAVAVYQNTGVPTEIDVTSSANTGFSVGTTFDDDMERSISEFGSENASINQSVATFSTVEDNVHRNGMVGNQDGPTDWDVYLFRGVTENYSEGTFVFKQHINNNYFYYKTYTPEQKKLVAKTIVDTLSGVFKRRFFTRVEVDGQSYWELLEYKEAVRKTQNSLRDKSRGLNQNLTNRYG